MCPFLPIPDHQFYKTIWIFKKEILPLWHEMVLHFLISLCLPIKAGKGEAVTGARYRKYLKYQ